MSENTEDKTKKLVEKAFRKKTGINERLLCMRLIQATFATDTKSIIANTCVAASMVEEGYPELEDFNFEKFRIIKKIFDDINQTIMYHLKLPRSGPYDYSDRYTEIYPIPWSIDRTEKIYENYINPWHPILEFTEAGIKEHRQIQSKITHETYLSYNQRGCGKLLAVVDPKDKDKEEQKWIGKTCPYCNQKIKSENEISISTKDFIVEEPKWTFFFEMSHCLSAFGFRTLRTAFYNWSRDECGKALMIMGRLVSQNIYDDVLKQLKGSHEESEENRRRE